MRIYAYILSILSSLLCCIQTKAATEEKDTIPLFCGVAVSVDVAGPALIMLSDYGQYEAALRVNLKDKYFPVFELGYGIGKHKEDPITGVAAEAKAPYMRIGADYNMKKDKHDGYRLYGGLRYGFTSFNSSISSHTTVDPIYGGEANYSITDEKSSFHWLEGVFGVDAKIAGPFRMGWSVRYKRKLTSSDVTTGSVWYVPGFGTDGSSHWGGTFNLTFEL